MIYGKSKQESKCGAAGSRERAALYLENRNLRTIAVALAMEISIGGAIYLLMNIALKNRILSEMLTKVLKKHNTGFQDS